MNRNEDTYGQLLLGFVVGDLAVSQQAEAEALYANDAGFALQADSIRPVHNALLSLGVSNRGELPQVDLLDRVLALVDSDVDEDVDLIDSLLSLGDEWRDSVPAIDLCSDLPDIVGDAQIAESLASLGEDLRSSVPAVQLARSLKRALPSVDEEHPEPALEAALFATGMSRDLLVPEVDLWTGISAALDAVTTGPRVAVGNVVPLRRDDSFPRPHRRDSGLPRWMVASTLAAAACLLMALAIAARFAQPTIEVMVADGAHDPSESIDGTLGAVPQADTLTMAANPDSVASSDDMGQAGATEGMAGETTLRRPVTLKEVVDAYRHTVQGNAVAIGRMAAWASLTREEARQLLEQADLSPEAVLGAAEFLAPEDAVKVLQAAVDNAPDDPYLRYALANRYQDTNDVDGYRRSLNEWTAVDPENAMPHFLSAQLMFASGDVSGGIASVHNGVSLGKSSSYSAQSARNRASALEASGYDSDTARYLAASTAGEEEYSTLRTLGDDLLSQAQSLEAAGDFEGAADLYDAVRVYGEQMMVGATSPNTQMAALEIQDGAVAAMLALQQVWTPETIQALNVMAGGIATGLNELGSLLGDVSEMLASESVTQTLNVTDAILSGDLTRLWELTNSN